MNHALAQAGLTERRSLSPEVANLIKKLMIDGDPNPGERIVETGLARQLGLSQTPVREAIRLLSARASSRSCPTRAQSPGR